MQDSLDTVRIADKSNCPVIFSDPVKFFMLGKMKN